MHVSLLWYEEKSFYFNLAILLQDGIWKSYIVILNVLCLLTERGEMSLILVLIDRMSASSIVGFDKFS